MLFSFTLRPAVTASLIPCSLQQENLSYRKVFYMPKLILCRHGQSEWNAKNLFTGWTDVDLSLRYQLGQQVLKLIHIRHMQMT